MYTIGQVSEMFGLPISTLRYYDREGLFPSMERKSGIRQFGEQEVEALRVIECLKASGLEIKDIKQFMQWCTEGAETFPERKALFEARRDAVKEEMERLQQMLALLEYKCWYYDEACKNGSEDPVLALLPDRLPPDIQKLFDAAHLDG